jgi:hypothetical protein
VANRSRSPTNGSQIHFTEGEAPSVARPSEAVRVGGESIAITHKRVADPFYGTFEPRAALRFALGYHLAPRWGKKPMNLLR